MIEHERAEDEVIELGTASNETKGGQDDILDSALSLQKNVGIADD